MLAVAIVTALVLVLAWANGANDVSRGIATLVGNGSTGARRAVWWGTFWVALGGLAAIAWGAALVQAFSSSFLSPAFPVSLSFVAHALVGATVWIFFATRTGLPVSTTHALLGGIVGAALFIMGPPGLAMSTVINKAFLPLIIGPLIAIFLCALLLLATRLIARRVPMWTPGCCSQEAWRENPFICAPEESRQRTIERVWHILHWASGAATSFARGLNDVPKIAAFLILALSLAPATTNSSHWIAQVAPFILVTAAMSVGSLWGGFKVLDLLAHRVTPLDASSGVVANVGTSLLVLVASPLGLPMSTTHVSAGALMGVRLSGRARPRQDALKAILFGWLITVPIAATVAASSSWLLSSSATSTNVVELKQERV